MVTSRHRHTARSKATPQESGSGKKSKGTRRNLSTVALTGLGIGGIIGAGFFLGSGIVIRQVGPGIVLTYLLAGLVLAQVMGAITSMAINIPVKTSYQEYIERYLGTYAGFLLGWAVFISGILAIGSEAVAMAVYSRTWFPSIALGVYAVSYVVIIILLNTLGMANLGKAETLMSIVKTSILVGFIVVAALLLTGLMSSSHPQGTTVMTAHGGILPYGPLSIFRGMLIVIFSYAGVTTVAMATARAKHPKAEIPKAALYTTIGVVLMYALSVLGLVTMVDWSRLSPHQSPFVTALLAYHYLWFARIFNGVILIASFSVMAGTFYATEWMLISMALQKGAPALFRHRGAGRPYPALLATAGAVLITLVLAFVLPRTVYTDLTAASSYFSFVNWLLILLAFLMWYHRGRQSGQEISGLAFLPPYGSWVMVAAIVGLGAYSVTVKSFQLGFYVFAAATVLISLTWVVFMRGRPAHLGH